VQKRFYIFNEPFSEEEYRKRIAEMSDEEILKRFEELKRSVPRQGVLQLDSENFTGDAVYHSRNVVGSFDVSECQDCGYLVECKNTTDSWDISVMEDGELCYNCSSCHIMHDSNCCYFCLSCSECEYSENLAECKNCFGCISLHRKQYYILNQPYEKDEYFKKVAEIKDQLCEGGLYGKMFVPSVFPREDTVVMWERM
jgi:hypothetical protein